MNTPSVEQSTEKPASKGVDAAASGSVYPRPKDGQELVQLLLDGKTCEIPSRHVGKTITYLDHVLSRASIDVKPSSPGWHTLKPDEAVVAQIQREVERDEAEDVEAEQAIERRSRNNQGQTQRGK